MSSAELAEYLKVLRESGVAQAEIVVPSVPPMLGSTTVRVVFAAQPSSKKDLPPGWLTWDDGEAP